MTLALVLAVVLAVARLSSHRAISAPADVFIGFFRGTPLLVQLIGIYTGLPQFGIQLSVLESAILALALNEAAYAAEIIRAGILSVDLGQMEAAKSLGMTYALAMRRIVLPQAARVMVPPLGNDLISMLKNTSLAAVISAEELLRRTQLIISGNFRTLELFTVASIYYLMMTFVLTWFQRRLERHLARHLTAERVQVAARVTE